MRRRLARTWSLLLPWSQRSLVLLLLCPTDHRRLFGKHLLKVFQKFRNTSSIPHACPVSKIWMVYPAIYTHMLPRPNQHLLLRDDIGHRRLLWIAVRYP